MKKIFSLLTALVLLAAPLVACSGTSTTAAPAETSAAAVETKAAAETTVAAAVETTVAAAADATSAVANTSGKKLKIAFIPTSNIDESMLWFRKNAEEEALALGCEFVAYDPNGDIQKQVNLVSDAVAAGCDGIVMQAMDQKAVIPAFQKAKEAGVVITLFGADIDPSGQQYRDFVCAPDDTAAGRLAGESMIKHFPDGASGVEIMGAPGSDPAIKRETGFEEAIGGSNIELLDKQYVTNWDPAIAMSIMEDYITKYGDKIQYVYSHWDNASTTIVQALENAGMLENVYILSVDGARVGFDLVKEGKIAATMAQDLGFQARECVKAVVKIKNGETVEPYLEDEFVEITADKADYDPGW